MNTRTDLHISVHLCSFKKIINFFIFFIPSFHHPRKKETEVVDGWIGLHDLHTQSYFWLSCSISIWSDQWVYDDVGPFFDLLLWVLSGLGRSVLLSLVVLFACCSFALSHFVSIQTFIGLKFHSLYKTQTHFRSNTIALLPGPTEMVKSAH